MLSLAIYTLVSILAIYFLKAYFRGPRYVGSRPDLRGKVAIVTGGNAGIGRCVVRALAAQGCRVIFGARDVNRSKETATEINNIGAGVVEYHHLDLSDLESVRNFVSEVSKNASKIDFLINNAGIMGIPKRTFTKDGFEIHYAVNYLGHFYLTHLLWSLLNKSQYFRVINVSSMGHKRIYGFLKAVAMDHSDLHFQKSVYSSPLAYSRSKLCNLLFTRALAERVPAGRGITLSVHPGVVRTDIMAGFTRGWIGILYKIASPIFVLVSKNAQEGAQTILKLLFEEEGRLKNGCYYSDCAQAAQSSAVNSQNWNRLWQLSQRDLNIKFGQI